MVSNYYQIVVEYLDHLKTHITDPKLVLEITAAGALSFAILYVGFFSKRGIKTPPYRFFYGNLPEIRTEGFSNVLMKWTQTYGQTYGYYEGHMPVLVTSDLDMIEEIFFKQFSNFTGRRLLPVQVSDSDEQTNVFSSARNRWKRLRTTVNPIFSPLKLKEFLPSMKICSDRLLQVIDRNLGTEIMVSNYLDRMAMDVVWKCMFGIDVDIQSNPNLSYFVKAQETVEGFSEFNPFLLFMTYFYELKPYVMPIAGLYTFLASKISNRFGFPFFWLIQQANYIVNQKTNSKNRQHDYISMLLELQSEEIDSTIDKKQYDQSSSKLIQKKISPSEIANSVVSFLFAGFDTTAGTLAFCFYILINHPEEMARIQEELDSLAVTDITYENLNQLEYLELFIKEVMRMYPVGNIVVTRRCTQPTTLKGIDIPEDLLIVVDVLSLHYNPSYWGDVDPNIFHPKRFADSSKINKLAFMSFGAGSRVCMGMKFAIMEIKLTLAKILMKYDVLPATPNPKDLLIREGTFSVRRPKHGISAIFQKRA